MPRIDIAGPSDLAALAQQLRENGRLNGSEKYANAGRNSARLPPIVLSVDDLQAIRVQAPDVLVDQTIPTPGASLVVGPSKSCKTILAVQAAICVATGEALFGYYKVNNPGPVLIIENDDPGGVQSIKQILAKRRIPVSPSTPLFVTDGAGAVLDLDFLDWLKNEIKIRSLRMVVLDSYTSLRPSRNRSSDIVKCESFDFAGLDKLGKNSACALLVIHHHSKGSAGLDWSEKAAGSYAVTAATESQISVGRFSDLEGNAPERLIRIRGRHLEGVEMVLKFNKETLAMEHVLEGGAASVYPLMVQLKTAFGTNRFAPRQLTHELGIARATAARTISRLLAVGVIHRLGYGEYALERSI